MADEVKPDRLIVERIKKRLKESDDHERKNFVDNPREFKIAQQEHAAEVLGINLGESDTSQGGDPPD